jgi:hypothetical protein
MSKSKYANLPEVQNPSEDCEEKSRPLIPTYNKWNEEEKKWSTSTPLSLRKANKLRIPRDTVCANIVLLEPVLHVYASRFVKVNPSTLHDAHDFLLRSVVESLSRIASFDISRQIKRGGR